ncbi:ubiquitin-specific protease doa4 [Coemansia sp. RSA 2705]|nr:ubiquitin-specific protease doa4 [Coemansia sp. RSA 2705]
MSKVGDGRTSDLIQRFEKLALEKGGGLGRPPIDPAPKRVAAGSEAQRAKRRDGGAEAASGQAAAAGSNGDTRAAGAGSAKPAAERAGSRARASSVLSNSSVHAALAPSQRESSGRSRADTIEAAPTTDTGGRRKSLLSELNRRADIDPTLQVSQSSWLAFAERCIDEARGYQQAGDSAAAYVRYMMACNIYTKKFRKLRDGSAIAQDPACVKLRKDVSSWVVDELEKLHAELERRPYVEQEEPAAMTSEQLDQMESRFAQMFPENPGASPRPAMARGDSGDSAAADARLLAERQSRFDEIDAQVRQNEASVQSLQSGLAAVSQSHSNRRVAVAVSPTQPSAVSEFFDPNATTCTARELSTLLEKARGDAQERPRVLLLDVRAHADFERAHIDHAHVVNVDPLGLKARCTSADIETALVLVSSEQQAWFRRRDEFDLVVYVSQSMRSFSDSASSELRPLEHLNSAVYHYEYSHPLRRPPLFLIGGFDAWVKEFGLERCVGSESARRANVGTRQATQPAQQPAQQQPQFSAPVAPSADISSMLPYNAPTSTLSQASYHQQQQQSLPLQQPQQSQHVQAPGSVYDFFQHNAAHQQQPQPPPPQMQLQGRHRPAYQSTTHSYIPAPEVHYINQQPQQPMQAQMQGPPAQLMHPPSKTVFDNPTYGFTSPAFAAGRGTNEYPAVESPHPPAMAARASEQESAKLMEQRRRRRTPPQVPMPQPPQLPPKPTAYAQQPQQQQPPPMAPRSQMQQAQLQTASPRASMHVQPAFYTHPVAAGSDPSLNGRMHAGTNLRSSGAYQHQIVMQPDPAMTQMAAHATAAPASRRTSHLPDSAAYGATGLKNFGNTCFMNSVIQCLAGTGPMTRYFMRGEWKKDLLRDSSARSDVAVEFARLLESMWRGQYASISPIGFRAAVAKCSEQFKGNEQEDAHEFASFLLDTLHESLNHVRPRPPPERELTADEELQFERLSDAQQAALQWARFTRRNWSIVTSIFQGQIQSRLTCLSCKHTSTTYHTFSELSVPIPSGSSKQASALVRKSQARNAPVNIYQCLDAYSETEILDGDNKWLCPRCKTKRKATKRLLVARLPLVLIVHLKRFSTIGHFREKLETNVLVPTQKLYMQNYVIDAEHTSTMYNLYGVANHFGTLSSGHYTASVFNGLRDQWNYFDDTRVSPIPEPQVPTPAAYLLFFVQTQP